MAQTRRDCKGGKRRFKFRFKLEGEAGGETGDVIEEGSEKLFLPTFTIGHYGGRVCLAAGRVRLESCAQDEVL